MPKAVLTTFTRDSFREYVKNTNFSRVIKYIQNHHTWKPNYTNLTPARDEMYWLETMRTSHIRDRKWSDIGQNITTFPSGNILLCRPINITPAGIFGANTGAICIEHFGDFDIGGDSMTEEHRKSIIYTNAVLCEKFGLAPEPSSVVYHHWFDTKGKRFTDESINTGYVLKNSLQKTCPGTNFFSEPVDSFKGNTITAAKKNFYPEITSLLQELKQLGALPIKYVEKEVTAAKLNVRSGNGLEFGIVRSLSKGAEIRVFETAGD